MERMCIFGESIQMYPVCSVVPRAAKSRVVSWMDHFALHLTGHDFHDTGVPFL